jgi:hypothetical protein
MRSTTKRKTILMSWERITRRTWRCQGQIHGPNMHHRRSSPHNLLHPTDVYGNPKAALKARESSRQIAVLMSIDHKGTYW